MQKLLHAMPEKYKTLLYTVAIILLFVLLLVIIWLVYNYQVHKLDNEQRHVTALVPFTSTFFNSNIY